VIVLSGLQRGLERTGELVAALWLTIFGIFVLFAFPISGIAASLLVGVAAGTLVGSGSFGIIVLVATAFVFGLFLSVYVWEPHVKSVIYSLCELISTRRPE
jgi:hypothetical protein